MSEKLYVNLGKFGDIMSLLPILHEESKSGFKPSLMVAKKYASILDGVSYVKPIVFDGDASNLTGAMMEAKKTGLPVVCTQVCGPPDQVFEYVYKALTPQHAASDCWQKEQYRAAGMWSKWRQQFPLVFDQRDHDRELEIIKKFFGRRRKIILVSTEGETCPFPYKKLLMSLLDGAYRKSHTIIDLDGFRAERIYDLIGLFNGANVLIAADSALLHLAQASSIPVCALTNDRPGLWHGAAWRPKHIFYGRYRDFADRAMDILAAIDRIGMPGCPFYLDRKKRSWIHICNTYEITNENRARHEKARQTWVKQYHFRNWIACPIEVGACGRDSKLSPLKDASRFPFVRDVVQMAEMRAKDDDVIVLTPPDVCFDMDIEQITHFPAFGSRTERSVDGDTHNPRPDFFAFTAGFWKQHRSKFPDMIMGPDGVWRRALREFLRMNGGREVENATFLEVEP